MVGKSRGWNGDWLAGVVSPGSNLIIDFGLCFDWAVINLLETRWGIFWRRVLPCVGASSAGRLPEITSSAFVSKAANSLKVQVLVNGWTTTLRILHERE